MKAISNKMMSLWTLLLDNPGVKMDLVELGRHTKMTLRQTCSVVNRLPSPPVMKVAGDFNGSMQVYFDGTSEDAIVLKRKLLIEHYELPDDIYDTLRSLMSSAAWLSANDIAMELDLECACINRLIMSMDGIETKCKGNKTKGSIYCKLPSE